MKCCKIHKAIAVHQFQTGGKLQAFLLEGACKKLVNTMKFPSAHKVDEDKCIGCGECVDNCPRACIELVDGKAKFTNAERCCGCFGCF